MGSDFSNKTKIEYYFCVCLVLKKEMPIYNVIYVNCFLNKADDRIQIYHKANNLNAKLLLLN